MSSFYSVELNWWIVSGDNLQLINALSTFYSHQSWTPLITWAYKMRLIEPYESVESNKTVKGGTFQPSWMNCGKQMKQSVLMSDLCWFQLVFIRFLSWILNIVAELHIFHTFRGPKVDQLNSLFWNINLSVNLKVSGELIFQLRLGLWFWKCSSFSVFLTTRHKHGHI